MPVSLTHDGEKGWYRPIRADSSGLEGSGPVDTLADGFVGVERLLAFVGDG